MEKRVNTETKQGYFTKGAGVDELLANSDSEEIDFHIHEPESEGPAPSPQNNVTTKSRNLPKAIRSTTPNKGLKEEEKRLETESESPKHPPPL